MKVNTIAASPRTERPPGTRRRQEDSEGEEIKESGLEFGHRRNPGHRLGVDRVQGKERASHEGPHTVAGQPLGQQKDEADDENVQQKADEMEAVGPQAKQLVADQISQRHQRTIVIGHGARARERPNVGGKNLLQVVEASDIRVRHDLGVVIIDKAVKQNVEIRQGGASYEGHDQECAGAVQPGNVLLGSSGQALTSFPGLGRRGGVLPASRQVRTPPRSARQTESSNRFRARMPSAAKS